MSTLRDEDGYVQPLTAWLMVVVLALMAWMYEGGRLLVEARHAALVADIGARAVTQLIDEGGLRVDGATRLDESEVRAEVARYLGNLGYQAQTTVDVDNRAVTVVASRSTSAGALRALGVGDRTIRGSATAVSEQGVIEPGDR